MKSPENGKHRLAVAALLVACFHVFWTSLASAQSTLKLPPAQEQPTTKDGEWLTPSRDYANTRFSPLTEITTENVKGLKVAWTFSMGVNRGQEAAPLVVGDTMYVVSPYPNILYALDLKNPGAMKWKYEPKTVAAAQGVACCDTVNRGAAFEEGRLFYNTLDNQTVAVDAATGSELWKTSLGDINKGETMTMAPLVAKGKVLVGNSGGEMGVRGWITALEASSGKVLWKGWNTGPDSDVLIGPDFKPFYSQDRGKDLGIATWPQDAWRTGGATVWGWISYDPETNLLFHGTGNPGPWNAEQRPGDNKWTSGLFARDLDTGAARWFYQWSPHDLHDYDGINENILIETEINGTPRKVLVRPERNGYVYVLDRATGEVLSADAYVYITSTKGVDLKSGQLLYNEEKKPQLGKVVREICPNASGAKDWNPAAYSPLTKLLYIPRVNLCMDWEGVETSYIAGTPYVGANVRMHAGPGGHRGVFTAWDIKSRKAVWEIRESFPLFSGTTVTASDVVFYGTMDGYFKAVHGRTGEVLWQFKVGSGIVGQPITYLGPDNKQYVAILSGVGGWAGSIVSADLDARDATAANGWGSAVGDLPQYTTKGGMLYVFSLG